MTTAVAPAPQVKRELAFEGFIDGRSRLRLTVWRQPDGDIRSALAEEILPDGTAWDRVRLIYPDEVARAGAIIERMEAEYQSSLSDPSTIGLIDGEYWLGELEGAAETGNVLRWLDAPASACPNGCCTRILPFPSCR